MKSTLPMRLIKWLFLQLFICGVALASGVEHSDPVAPILLGLAIIFIGAKAGALFATKCGQPAVLGELLAGALLGNLALFGFDGLSFIIEGDIFSILAGIGVVLLLFEVGLESSIKDILGVGVTSAIVAVIGVIAPFILGYFTSYCFFPDKSFFVHTFVGATLCATSVGITARVFKDLNKIKTKEAKIILGAAVIDDVLGLIILAVVSGAIVATNSGGASMSIGSILFIAFKAIAFLGFSLFIGQRLAPSLYMYAAKLKAEGMLLSLTLALCFLLAFVSNLVGLAPIVGSFAAGLIIDGTGFPKFFTSSEKSIEDLLHPISKFFVPIFFVHMGMQVDLSTFADPFIIACGLTLTAVAIIGKQACGLGVLGKENQGINKLMIGVGMIPRGEVGLIFAAIGASLSINGEVIIDTSLYSSIVLMVMLTTMVTPPGLKYCLKPKNFAKANLHSRNSPT